MYDGVWKANSIGQCQRAGTDVSLAKLTLIFGFFGNIFVEVGNCLFDCYDRRLESVISVVGPARFAVWHQHVVLMNSLTSSPAQGKNTLLPVWVRCNVFSWLYMLVFLMWCTPTLPLPLQTLKRFYNTCQRFVPLTFYLSACISQPLSQQLPLLTVIRLYFCRTTDRLDLPSLSLACLAPTYSIRTCIALIC